MKYNWNFWDKLLLLFKFVAGTCNESIKFASCQLLNNFKSKLNRARYEKGFQVDPTLRSVHKYFGGGGLGNWKCLSSNFFDPLCKPLKLFEPPLTSVKTFLPPPHCYMYNISVFPQHLFIWHVPHTGVPVLLVTLKN